MSEETREERRNESAYIFDATKYTSADQIPGMRQYEPLAPGIYEAVLVDCEIRDNKAGTGIYLNCQFELCDEKYRGRRVFEMFNLENPSQQAVLIAQHKLASFCMA